MPADAIPGLVRHVHRGRRNAVRLRGEARVITASLNEALSMAGSDARTVEVPVTRDFIMLLGLSGDRAAAVIAEALWAYLVDSEDGGGSRGG